MPFESNWKGNTFNYVFYEKNVMCIYPHVPAVFKELCLAKKKKQKKNQVVSGTNCWIMNEVSFLTRISLPA